MDAGEDVAESGGLLGCEVDFAVDVGKKGVGLRLDFCEDLAALLGNRDDHGAAVGRVGTAVEQSLGNEAVDGLRGGGGGDVKVVREALDPDVDVGV